MSPWRRAELWVMFAAGIGIGIILAAWLEGRKWSEVACTYDGGEYAACMVPVDSSLLPGTYGYLTEGG